MKRPDPLPSYVAQEAFHRQKEQQLEGERHLGNPPATVQLIRLRMVLPRETKGLSGLDEVRRTKTVWITSPEKNIIDLHAEKMTHLRQALSEINWMANDELQEERAGHLRLMLQTPTKATEQSRVFISTLRPQVIDPTGLTSDIAVAVKKAAASLAIELAAGADKMLTSTKELEMKTCFGHLRLASTRHGHGQGISYRDLERQLRQYAERGGARFETRFVEPYRAERLLRYLLDPESGCCHSADLVRQKCCMTFLCDGAKLSADIIGPASTQPQFASVRLIVVEPRNRLNLVTACPDLHHDWNLQIHSSEHIEVPDDLHKRIMKLRLEPARREGAHDMLKQPGIDAIFLGQFGKDVFETHIRTSVIVPWKSSPYLIEVGITTVWHGVDVRTKSRVFWDMQLYGNHWESAVNRTQAGMRRKDWGEDMCDVWPGPGESLERRLENFTKEILEVQAMLEVFS